MIGMHQVRNAAVSIKVAKLLGDHGFQIDPGHVKRGLMKAYWPGRMEKVSDTPLIFLDGAHNPEGVAALVKTIQGAIPRKACEQSYSLPLRIRN